ncbi:MAG: hypothetical protein B0W54_19825 [Cellvibrio sp. 79]|nr:MAG: hypothetical protein B0W54_19825 [Cellvibrio sp. 79]
MQTQSSFWLKTLAAAGLAFGVIYFYNSETQPVTTQLSTASTTAANTTTKPLTAHNNIEQDIPVTSGNNKSNVSLSSSAMAGPELQARMDSIKQRRPGLDYSPEEVAAAVARSNSWTPAENTPADLPLKPEELTDGRQFIQLDTVKIETLMPDDAINVRVAENAKDYAVVIDKVEKHDYNSISWYGHIQGEDGQKYSVSFTRGETLTVGGLDTPDGHYVLQAHGNNGWIASSQLLFKADPNVSDAIHPADVDPNYAHTRDSHQHQH